MRRILLAVPVLCGVLAAAAPAAATGRCVTPDPRPCAGVAHCSFGGDPESLWLRIKAGNRRAALRGARRAVRNLRRARVRPRVVDVVAWAGGKRVYVRTRMLGGRHWHYSYGRGCWVVR